MPQPTAYNPSFSFSEDEAQSPNGHVPGVSIDAEFDAIATTLLGVLANLLKLQRDDGALKNAIVTLDALSPAVILALGAGGSWTPKGAWVAGADYAIGDVVTVGTGTYVGTVAHAAAATFDAEPAGAWIKLYDDAGAIPDGTITSAMFAAGAVNDAALGITTFDITGAGRAAGGLAAGTAAKGSLLTAKLDAGDVYVGAERKTDAQGAVGYKIIGPALTWALELAADSERLQLSAGGVAIGMFFNPGGFELAGAIRAVATGGALGDNAPGCQLTFVDNVGYLVSFDWTANQWRTLNLQGLSVILSAAGVAVLNATANGVDFPLGLTNKGAAVGFLGIPQNVKSAAYQLAKADVGGHVYSANAAAQVITVPAAATVAWATDDTILIINDGTSPITLQQAAGVTIRLAGTATTGNRTIGAGGMCFLKYVAANRWFASGPGVS
jgi:hypothetical protein